MNQLIGLNLNQSDWFELVRLGSLITASSLGLVRSGWVVWIDSFAR